jgi:N-acylneuraminate cytidylyltransferase
LPGSLFLFDEKVVSQNTGRDIDASRERPGTQRVALILYRYPEWKGELVAMVGMIFARGGSKGIPNKNLQVVAGKPLITRAIETGQATAGLDRLIVSTDSDEIAEIALAAGAEIPFMRPNHLASDTSAEWLSWRHALVFLRETDGALPNAMVSIPTTSPLRLASDVDACITAYQQGSWDAIVTVTEAQRSPYFNMVSINPSGQASIAVEPSTNYMRRQDAPQLYDMCTVAYVVRGEFVLQSESLWSGRVGAVVIPQERALDIDTPFDLRLAQLLLGDQTAPKSGP